MNRAEITEQLTKHFMEAGYEVRADDFGIVVGNQHINVREKRLGNNKWNQKYSGKFYVVMTGADYLEKLFHQKQGQLDYAKIVAEFKVIQEAKQRQREQEQKREELRSRVEAFEAQLVNKAMISLSARPFEVSVLCQDEEQMYAVAKVVDEFLKYLNERGKN